MKGVLILCAFLVAASYGGDTDEKTDATVVESCTNTMSSLLRAKHAAIMGLETISSGQGDAKLAMDEADDAQIAAAENEAEKNVNKWYGKDGKDLGETLQSASKADVKSWKARVGGMTRKLAALQKRYAHAAPTALDSAFELGESNPANKLPTPVVAPGKDHHKEIIFQCMANVMKLVTSVSGLATYSSCLKKSKPRANKWPNVVLCGPFKPRGIKTPMQGDAPVKPK